MDKIFNPKNFESEIFEFWLELKLFNKKNNNKEKFTIILPPPNITGKLHLGHAWDGTIQDKMIRYKKLKGFNTLWIAGMDHAGIATQTKFEKFLNENKISKENFSRKDFIDEIIKWSSDNVNDIRKQWKKMGFSLDYENEKFTLNKENSKFINNVFVKLYKKKLIYRDYKLVNWDIKLKTAISNIEVITKPLDTKLYYIYYKLANSSKKLVVATTRPETMFADTCLVVNPNDNRFKKYIGEFAINPSNNEKIKIISDEYVDIKYGTGVMKCTPAHDFNDYKIGIKYKQKFNSCIEYDGKMNELANEFVGIDRLECRKLLIEKLHKENYIKKIENQISNINFSERSGEIIEPLLSLQWFMKMNKISLEIKNIQKSKKGVIFYPKRFEKDLLNWLNKIEDWCISRQLIWGHQIPVWMNSKNKKIIVSEEKPKGQNWIQDPDVFDTWFSSGMWPILATNNYSKNKTFYPTDLLVTGYDIILFWVLRMIIFTKIIKNDIPFKNVFIHGLIRDSNGMKMSKSLNNGIDPMDVISKYGADTLRLFLISSSTIGEDLIYSEEKIISMSKFLNKLWNIANFINLKIINKGFNKNISPDIFDIWIMNKFNIFLYEYDKDIEKYNFVVATSKIIKFIKNDFSSTYIELNKWKLESINSYFNFLVYDLFKKILIIIHPICPFISEKIFNELYNSKKSILNFSWPEKYNSKKEKLINNFLKILEEIRKFKWENKFIKKDLLEINLFIEEKNYDIFISNINFLYEILKREKTLIKEINLKNNLLKLDNNFISLEFCTIEFLKNNSNKFNNENLIKEIKKIKFEIDRSEKILSNNNFILKAPKSLVESEKIKLLENKKILIELKNNLKKNI